MNEKLEIHTHEETDCELCGGLNLSCPDGCDVGASNGTKTNYCQGCKERQDRLETLTAENERLREALGFYAYKFNWKSCGVYMSGQPQPSGAEIDRGDKARAALQPQEKVG